jgi:hypothetical protein
MLCADLESFGATLGLKHRKSCLFKLSFAEFDDREFVVDN